jgi:hypothetical protein
MGLIMKSDFRGPVFIIGKPRSGTKLLARILEQHPNTAIEVAETQFIPYLLTNQQLISDLGNRARFEAFYESITKSTAYFSKYHQDLIPLDLWYESCADYSISAVLEVLIKFYTNQLGNPEAVWGDKSNNYIVHVALLKRHLPSAKFIHIVRDVRDASLSSYSAWRTNIYRYSQRWYDDVNMIRRDAKALPESDYLELRYEDLLGDAEKTVRQCTDFLGLDFDERMLTFKKQSEAVGDARGMKTIKSDNVGKYEQRLSPEQVQRIEKIAWPLLKEYGYSYEYAGNQESLSRGRMLSWQFLDVLNRMRFDFGKIGLAKFLREMITLRYFRGQYHHFKQIVSPRLWKR